MAMDRKKEMSCEGRTGDRTRVCLPVSTSATSELRGRRLISGRPSGAPPSLVPNHQSPYGSRGSFSQIFSESQVTSSVKNGSKSRFNALGSAPFLLLRFSLAFPSTPLSFSLCY